MKQDFVHLHNHTDFSLQDAAQSVDQMCDRLTELQMDTIAVTEHGNLFSMIPFYKKATKAGIKPILGCEIYVSVGDYTERMLNKDSKGKKWNYHHLVLLCMNETGYKNLMKLVSIGYLEGFYYRPRVDKALLKKYNEGLIATSACLAGEVTHYASIGEYDRAKEAAIEYSEIFPDRFYLELQDHDIPEEKQAHSILKKISSELGLPLVCTNDCHYAQEDHWQAHDVLFCLGTGKNRNDRNRLRYEPRKFYIKSADEMWELFKEYPDALENTVRIAEQCNVEIPMGNYHLPRFPIPEGSASSSADDYLKMLCQDGLQKRYSQITPNIQNRLNYELNVIKKMGFAGYFLITMDFVKYAKTNLIPVGPGRGSAAGSIVAYTTGITDVDPIKYNLLFERFLNPDRISMPDIDIDFCIEGRQKVIDYIKDLYGEDSVAQIITFGTMKAKSVVRDVGRVLGMPFGEINEIAKLIPNEPKMTLDKAMKMNKEFSSILKKDETHKELIEYSQVLEGLHRHASTHAAGVVIAPGPLTDYVPLYQPAGTKDVATQADMNDLESLGLLKMDFLGLRNLTVINKTIQSINDNYNEKIDIDNLNLKDGKVFDLFSKGKTIGVFQFESQGMREYLKKLKPSAVEDLIAMNALYRPGPMQNIPDFISRKHGNSPVTYLHEKLEPILKETYGIIVYQEQVMEICQSIGGFSLAQGDTIRRAMGKKKADLMTAFKVDFVEGAVKQEINKKIAIEIFELLEKFAEYGFNKSHSTAYALIAYQTAWLKTYYPSEFLAENMNTEMKDINRIVTLINEAKDHQINVEAPSVNISFSQFKAISKDKISFGLSAIKNVGAKAAESIAEYRINNQLFKTIFDLCKIDSGAVNRRAVESLVQAGACDELEGSRAEQFDSIDTAIKFGQKIVQEKNSLQESLFSGSNEPIISEPTLNKIEDWTKRDHLRREKEMLGFYLSGNPLDDYLDDLNELNNINLLNLPKKIPPTIKLGGIITNVNKRFDKRNREWAIIEMDGFVGNAEIFIFSDVFSKYQNYLEEDKSIFIIGSPSKREEEISLPLKFIANQIIPLSDAKKKIITKLNILLKFEENNENTLLRIQKIISENPGDLDILIHLESNVGTIKKIQVKNKKIACSSTFLSELRNEFGESNIWIN
tara:strand:- start:697 stop:4143 length:3447 start_codon:yes stop_codon:yes gene_type:complete